MNYWRIRDLIKHIMHPFKNGFWCRMCIVKADYTKHPYFGMLWEEWDSYAGDGDYGCRFGICKKTYSLLKGDTKMTDEEDKIAFEQWLKDWGYKSFPTMPKSTLYYVYRSMDEENKREFLEEARSRK